MDREMAETLNRTLPDLKEWLPIRIYWQDGAPQVDWCYFGQRQFTEPFFESSVSRNMWLPFNILFRHQTSIDSLAEWGEQSPGVEPAGFIFHLSRCGSTLISQMLAALQQNIVLSEPGPVDTILNASIRDPRITEEERLIWLKALVSGLSQRRTGKEMQSFIKFDSWHTVFLPLISKAFPNVPKIFLYRDPVEIVVSQLKQRGSQTIAGAYTAKILGLDMPTAYMMAAEEYCSRVLARTCEAVLEANDKSILLCNYNTLPEFFFSHICSFFNFQPTEEEIGIMRDATKRDAKEPSFIFEKDTERKQSEATQKVRDIVNELVMPLYDKLELLRAEQTKARISAS